MDKFPNASQIRFEASGRGFVRVLFTHPRVDDKIVEVLHYATQGSAYDQLTGRAIDVAEENAILLNEAAAELNQVLKELSA